jgi:hypothetical protein
LALCSVSFSIGCPVDVCVVRLRGVVDSVEESSSLRLEVVE